MRVIKILVTIAVIGLLALLISYDYKDANAQTRPYHKAIAGCDEASSVFSVSVGFDAWYFTIYDGGTSGQTIRVIRFNNGTAISSADTLELANGQSFSSYVLFDSLYVIKTRASDRVCYEIAQ